MYQILLGKIYRGKEMIKKNLRWLFSVLLMLSLLGVSTPANAQGNWVFGNQTNDPACSYNPSNLTIQYYPPELGAGTHTRYNRTTPYFYEVPGRIEPNVQPNPLRDEMEKTDYV